MAAVTTLGEVLKYAKLRKPLTKDQSKWVAGLEYDSRKVEKDFLFFAFAGSRADGRQFAAAALAQGAGAVVSELSAPDSFIGNWIEVEHGRKALAIASGNFYRHPDQRILLTGVTGTNGKTTTSYLIDAILRHAGHVTGMIGTVEYRLADETRHAVNTTPESLDIIRFASELDERGGTHLTMEVSSHGLALARVYALQFHTAVFTNLTRDHLDFHQTMESYAAAKRLLFVPDDAPAPRWAILNADDPASESMRPSAESRILWFGMGKSAELRADNVSVGLDGLRFDMVYNGRKQRVISPLVGSFNVANILAAAGAAISYGLDLPAIESGIASCTAVPGRFERIDCGQPFLVAVDFAHTDDALRNVLQVARNLARLKQAGQVITVFGCGGDRDRTKRPFMGAAAAELSDFVVLTSDNPRSEDPLAIMNDVMVGLRRFDTPHVAEPDRATAIRLGLERARAGDVVVIAGKGHEPYQILKDRTIAFDDREVARGILRSLGYEVG